MSINDIQPELNDYFNEPPQTWNITTFLRRAINNASSLGLRFNQDLTHQVWNKNIRTLINDSDLERSTCARRLVAKWNAKGPRSDKSQARRIHARAQQQAPRNMKYINRTHRTQIGTNLGQVYTGRVLKLKKCRDRKSDTPDISAGYTSVDRTDSTPTRTATASPEPDSVYFMELDKEDKITLTTGKCVEDIVLRYAQSVNALDLSNWRIIDTADIELRAILKRDQWETVTEFNEDYPTCPDWFLVHIDKFKLVRDLHACDEVSATKGDQLHACDEVSATKSDQPDPFIIRWINRAYEHVVSLLTHSSLLSQPLGEGAWEGIYWNIIDLVFTNLDDLWLQRRDIPLSCASTDTTLLVDTAYRHDGVILTREVQHLPRVLEFGAIEVSSRWEGDDASKWNNDIGKLYVGCRAMLNALKEVVHNDPATVRKLSVVGIVQAGPNTMVFIMRCFGPHLYTLRRGSRHALPNHMTQIHKLSLVLSAIWIAREAMRTSYLAVSEYMTNPHSDRDSPSPHSPSFL